MYRVSTGEDKPEAGIEAVRSAIRKAMRGRKVTYVELGISLRASAQEAALVLGGSPGGLSDFPCSLGRHGAE